MGSMVKTFLFLIKMLILIIGLGWLLSLTGTVTIAFDHYRVQLALGTFLVFFLILSWGVTIVFRAIAAIADTPRAIARRNKDRSIRRGLLSLTRALSAIAVDDLRMADHYTQKTAKYLRDEKPLIAILKTLAAHASKDHNRIETASRQALAHDDSMMVGIRSLTATAMDKKDFRYARVLMDRALAKAPDAPWVMDTDYHLNAVMGQYDKAHISLKRMMKADLITKAAYKEKMASLFLGQGEVKKAYKMAPNTLPVVLAYLAGLPAYRHSYTARRVISDMWVKTPHPMMLQEWVACMPVKKSKDKDGLVNWVKTLHNLNPDDASSSLYCGLILYKNGRKDEAKPYIRHAIEVYPTIMAYRLMHDLDPIGGWLNFVHLARRDKTWVCRENGEPYEDWILRPEGRYFNELEWRYPEEDSANKTTYPRLYQLGGLNQLFQTNFN